MLDRDMEIWDRDAAYYYYLHGPLKRIELGEDKIQGIDFLYTINGWLKSVNIEDNHNNPEYGVSGATPGDAYGYTLDYYNDGSGDKDFVHNSTDFGNGATLLPTAGAVNHSLYDGNIAAWEEYYGSETSAKMPDPLNFESSRARVFQYDKLNRLKDNTTYNYTAGAWANSPNNSSHYNYDANGNLMNLVRNDNSGVQLDDLNYLYQDFRYSPSGPVYRTNRLSILKDMPGTTASTRDLETPDPVTDFYTYTYDASGNLTSDVKDKINHIEWTADGKVSYVEKDAIVTYNSSTYSQPIKISFMYDAFGNRVGKDVMINGDNIFTNLNQNLPNITPQESFDLLMDQVGVGSTYYMLDANGQVLAIYESKNSNDVVKAFIDNESHPLMRQNYHILSEWDIYGSAAHGKFAIRQPKEELVYTESEIPRGSAFYRIVGEKQYHLTDHLGNVRATVSDIKEPSGGGFLTNTITAASFYPFGFMEEGRFFFSGSNRWGFNGMEKDDKIKGAGNSLNTEFRMNDPRIGGRWWSLDPKPNPSISRYAGYDNNPVFYSDPRGDSAWKINNVWNEDYIKKYGQWVEQKTVKYFEEGVNLTCEDLAFQLLTDFASENNLPLILHTREGGVFDAASDDFTNKDDFIEALNTSSLARDLQNQNNTIGINKNYINLGDMILETDNLIAIHTQVVTSFDVSKPYDYLGSSGFAPLEFSENGGFRAVQGNADFETYFGFSLFDSVNPTDENYVGKPLRAVYYEYNTGNYWGLNNEKGRLLKPKIQIKRWRFSSFNVNTKVSKQSGGSNDG